MQSINLPIYLRLTNYKFYCASSIQTNLVIFQYVLMNRHDAGKVFLTMRTLVVLDRSPFVLLLHVRAQIGGLSEPGNQMVKYIRFFY